LFRPVRSSTSNEHADLRTGSFGAVDLRRVNGARRHDGGDHLLPPSSVAEGESKETLLAANTLPAVHHITHDLLRIEVQLNANVAPN
jgi:hypothetical protein